ncbi:MAG TPA: 3-hydroxyacyl-CoA dehydrogenase NAD-binding domain-containing protein [Kofleriaceae bacterium]|nr:3-hydroxyacyl-CoA dehydrogenase NAD-binding domain-containing protein [Kofleriaceae bacterium]
MSGTTIDTVGVVGAGQMGRGIAQVAAQAGLGVVVLDASQDQAAQGVGRIRKTLDRLVEKGKLPAEERDQVMARIEPSGDYADLGSCQFVVEATPEIEALKLGIFKKMNAATPAATILASNTSSISITKLGASTDRPDRVIGMHFMNPVPLMKLVEVVRGLPTSEETYKTTVELARRFGKTTIAARDIPGFIVNRVLIPLLNEACYALYEGLGDVIDIDTGVKLGLNHPMGPLELADLIGLDTCLAIASVLHTELGDDKYRPCPLLRQHVAAGWLGRKTGRGFYQYDPQGNKLATRAE